MLEYLPAPSLSLDSKVDEERSWLHFWITVTISVICLFCLIFLKHIVSELYSAYKKSQLKDREEAQKEEKGKFENFELTDRTVDLDSERKESDSEEPMEEISFSETNYKLED